MDNSPRIKQTKQEKNHYLSVYHRDNQNRLLIFYLKEQELLRTNRKKHPADCYIDPTLLNMYGLPRPVAR